MIHYYYILLILTSVLSSVFTVILLNKDRISVQWANYRNRRKTRKYKQQLELLEPVIKKIVLDYLKELSINGESNDIN